MLPGEFNQDCGLLFRFVKSWTQVNGICVVKALLLKLNELKLDIVEISLFQ